MKNEQSLITERFNDETGEFELANPFSDEEAVRIVSIFCAEEAILKRTSEIQEWLDCIRGVMHLEYD